MLARSGSFMSSSINPAAAGHHSKSYRKSATEANGSVVGSSPGGGNNGNGGAASDDSMHEKYFKSVENTPLSRRRHTTTAKCSSGAASASSGHGTGGSAGSNMKHSSDSSPQSPISPHSNKSKPLKGTTSTTALITEQRSSGGCGSGSGSGSNLAPSAILHSPGGHSITVTSTSSHTHYKQDASCNLELLNLDRLSLSSRGGGECGKPSSPHLSDITTAGVISTPNNLISKNFPSSDNIGMMTHSSRGSNDSRGKHKLTGSGSWSQKQQQQHNIGHHQQSTVQDNSRSVRYKTANLVRTDSIKMEKEEEKQHIKERRDKVNTCRLNEEIID